MGDLWGALVPLIIGSAVVPIQIVITTMLLRSASGRGTAVAWVAGMTAVRLGQGLLFGLIIGSGSASSGEGSGGTGHAVSLVLLVVAILFYVTAVKQLLRHPDEDAPPPKWMAMVESITPAKAFGLGAGLLLIGAKFWVFTLGAISAIGAAGLGQGGAVLVFLAFVVLAESIHLAIVGVAFAVPGRAAAMLDAVAGLLTRYNRILVIVLGLVFGTWFLVKALSGLGIL
jgi:hypothetical protein